MPGGGAGFPVYSRHLCEPVLCVLQLSYVTLLSCNACVSEEGKAGLSVLWLFRELMDYTLQRYFFAGDGRHCWISQAW